jgi:hypothetical protein
MTSSREVKVALERTRAVNVRRARRIFFSKSQHRRRRMPGTGEGLAQG